MTEAEPKRRMCRCGKHYVRLDSLIRWTIDGVPVCASCVAEHISQRAALEEGE
jgi:hypothetical protein